MRWESLRATRKNLTCITYKPSKPFLSPSWILGAAKQTLLFYSDWYLRDVGREKHDVSMMVYVEVEQKEGKRVGSRDPVLLPTPSEFTLYF